MKKRNKARNIIFCIVILGSLFIAYTFIFCRPIGVVSSEIGEYPERVETYYNVDAGIEGGVL